jgi:dynein heavy chain
MLLEDSDQKDQSAASHWPFLQMLLYEYQPYMQCVKGINLKLQNIMTEIEKYSKNYSCFSRMVESSSIIDVTSSLKKKEWFVGMFQNALAFFHDQVHGMQHMLQSFHVGMMRVDVKSFQEHVLSFPMQCIKELEYHLPKLAHEKCDAIIRNIKVSVDKLQTLPHNVELFVHYLHDVQNVTESLNDTEEKMTTVSKLYSVAQEFDISVGSEELALYHTIFSQFRHLRNVLLQAEATKVENVRHFSSDLKAEMIAVLHEAQELKTKIESLPLAEDSEEQELDLGPLQTLKKHQIVLTNLLTQAKNYLSYHQMISSISTSRRNYYHVDSISQYSWTPEEVYEEVQGIQQSLDVRKHLLESKKKWSELVVSWNKEQLKSLDIDKLQSEVNSYVNTLDYLEKGLPFNPMVSALADEVLAFKSLLPTLSCLLNPVLRIRHWDAIEQCTGHWFGKESETTLGHLQEIQIFEHHNEIVSVSNQANHEATLESMLTKLSMEWVSKEFTLVPYTTTGNRQTFLLGGVEDLFSSLEDSLTTLGTIKNSKYVAPVKHAVIDWESRLTLLMEVVEQWVLCQKNWLYLESIFASMDIQRQLSKEAKLFQRADKSWRDVINIISDKATALKSASTSGVLEAFQSCNALLEQVFRSLENYMESKRMSFPRLYFISDNELLDILSHIRSPHAILVG